MALVQQCAEECDKKPHNLNLLLLLTRVGSRRGAEEEAESVTVDGEATSRSADSVGTAEFR